MVAKIAQNEYNSKINLRIVKVQPVITKVSISFHFFHLDTALFFRYFQTIFP